MAANLEVRSAKRVHSPIIPTAAKGAQRGRTGKVLPHDICHVCGDSPLEEYLQAKYGDKPQTGSTEMERDLVPLTKAIEDSPDEAAA